ncbi:30S ribosomal protein S16 [Candidatus Omnitrophota bacterium]
MAVRIRLRRIGKNPKKRPHFRISVFDESKSRDSACLEELGHYDPSKNPPFLKLDLAKYDAWVKQGALASETIKSIAKKLKKGAINAGS